MSHSERLILPQPILTPNPFQPFPGTQTTVNQIPITKTNTVGIYATDTISWGPHWLLTGAIRYDSFRARFDQNFGAKPTHFHSADGIWRSLPQL